MRWWEPLAAYWTRKKWERLRYQTACRLLESIPSPAPCLAGAEPDADRWKLISTSPHREPDPAASQCLRDQARRFVEINPFASNALTLLRNYVVGAGMHHETIRIDTASNDDPRIEQFHGTPAASAPSFTPTLTLPPQGGGN